MLLETDSLVAISLLKSAEICWIAGRRSSCNTYREGNIRADWTANSATHLPARVHILETPPEELRTILLHDIRGAMRPRMVH